MERHRGFAYILFMFVLLFLVALACRGGDDEATVDETDEATQSEVTRLNVAPTEPEEDETVGTEPTSPPKPTITPAPTDTPSPTDTPEPPPTFTPAPIGLSRANPFPALTLVNAPNWDIQVLEVVRGDGAWQAIQAANQFNDPAPEGMEFVLVKIYAKSTYADGEAHFISGRDFYLTGDLHIRHKSPSVVDPDPILDAELFPDGETEGWAAFVAGIDEGNLILVFDELYFDAERLSFIALDDGASVSIPPELSDIEPNDLGIERTNPAPFGEKVVTEDWELQVLEVVRGDDAWSMVQEVNQINKPPEEGMEYIAVRVRARNIGDEDDAELIDSTWFETTGDANAIHNAPTVADPDPILFFRLYPGGEAEGWVVVQAQIGEQGVMLIFEPVFDSSGENTRYLLLQ